MRMYEVGLTQYAEGDIIYYSYRHILHSIKFNDPKLFLFDSSVTLLVRYRLMKRLYQLLLRLLTLLMILLHDIETHTLLKVSSKSK